MPMNYYTMIMISLFSADEYIETEMTIVNDIENNHFYYAQAKISLPLTSIPMR